jgi:hypothetical protein
MCGPAVMPMNPTSGGGAVSLPARFASTLIALRYRLHQEYERLPEARRSRRGTLVMSHTYDDKIVRGDNERGLPTCT